MTLRSVERLIPAVATSDGAGVKLNRSIGGPLQENLDPFLLLDEFASDDGADYIAGFPDHPHRGFETVTYMLDGLMRHEDNQGNGGTLRPGGAQWMTAGRGIVHSEMPEQEDGLMRGFQLWVNLPAVKKMTAPRYQNLEPDEIPEVEREDGVRIRVVAGRAEGTDGAVNGIAVDPIYLDVTIPAGVSFNQPIPAGHTAFCYLFEGTAEIVWDDGGPGTALQRSTLAVLGDGDAVEIRAKDEPARLLLVAGKPINEPIVRYGPFVMNAPGEIQQAINDYRSGKF